MVSSEIASLARTGGLGDVVEALSRTLAEGGADVVVVTPRYGPSRVPPGGRWWKEPVAAPLGPGRGREMRVYEAALGVGSGPRARVCMLEDAPLFDRDGIYGDARGGFADNALRFAAMSSGALGVAERAWDGALPDVVHAHDWHGAPAVVYARTARGEAWSRVPTVLTVHNLAFQGVADAVERESLGLPAEAWEGGWARHEGRVNLLKAGIHVADRVTTVSETYAREIQGPLHGHGLDAHLRRHAAKLTGIVNGIDTHAFDPRTDAAVARRYGEADAPEGRRACKAELVAELGLDAESPAPLFGVVSRLEWLKGIDLFLAILPALAARGARIVVEGTGARPLEDALQSAADRWPRRVASRVAFDPALARRIFAGADFLVVPSREEPCGLTQMYAMRYGAVPIVTPVGGLRDTVQPADTAHAVGTGFVAAGSDAISLLVACEDAIGIWRDSIAMEALVARAMARDSSWPASARRYLEVYASLGAIS
ncbi:MAG TPA: glycogen/starch synthase [Polyangiaceae bacterium]|jgi:starch synthase